MNAITRTLGIWCCIAVVLVCALVIFHLAPGFINAPPYEFYDYDELATLDLPAWDVTNAIPLSPEKAVSIAVTYLREQYPDVGEWHTQYIYLKQDNGTWIYRVHCRADVREHYWEHVQVLLNGEVWLPKKGKQ